MKRETPDEEPEVLFAVVFMLAMLVCIAIGLLAAPNAWPQSATPTATASAIPTVSATVTPRPSPSPGSTPRPSATATPRPSPSPSATVSACWTPAPAPTPRPCAWPHLHNMWGGDVVLPVSIWGVFSIERLTMGATEIQVFDRNGNLHSFNVLEPVDLVVQKLSVEPCY